MKSMNANVRIYNSIDQEWNRKSNPGSFLSKDYLDTFNYYINREGNIDWGLSFHPYNSPLYDPYAWNGPAVWVKNSITSPYITMQNIDILINYMHQGNFLNLRNAFTYIFTLKSKDVDSVYHHDVRAFTSLPTIQLSTCPQPSCPE